MVPGILSTGLRLGRKQSRKAAAAGLMAILLAVGLPASALADGSAVTGAFVHADGTPAANVQVNLLGAAGQDSWSSPSTMTDSAGQFSFAGLADGTYGLSFPGDGNCGAQNITYYYEGGAKFGTLEADAKPIVVAGIDTTPVKITCPKLYSISGRAVGPNGKGVAGIGIYASSGNTYNNATTGSNGNYTISGLPAGSYVLTVDDETGAFQSGTVGVDALGNNAFSGNFPTLFKVGPKSLTGARISLLGAFKISGRFTDPSGQPVAGLDVRYGPPGMIMTTHMATTAADGTYTIGGCSPSEHDHLYVIDPNNVYMPGYWSSKGIVGSLSAAPPISMGAGSVNHVDLTIPQGRQISGTVLGADGAPIAGAQVGAYPAGTSQVNPFGEASASTAGDGTFTLGGLAAGPYLVTVNTSDGKFGYYAGAGITQDRAAATLIDLSTPDTAGITINFSGAYYTLSGSIIGSDGQPIAYATVNLEGPGSTFGSSDGSGQFTIADVVPGTYTAYIAVPQDGPYLGGYWTGSGVSGDPSAAAKIAVSGDMTLSLVLPVATHITGQILNPSGLPISQPMVLAMANGAFVSSAASGADGRFDLAVPDGSYQIYTVGGSGAPEPGYYAAGRSGSFVIAASKATAVAATATGGQGLMITQPQMPRITGRLTRPNGAPVIGAAVMYYPVGSSDLPSATWPDLTGNFAVNALPGRYVLLVGNASGMDFYGMGGAMGPMQPIASQTGWYRDAGKDNFTLNKGGATAVTLGSKGVTGIDITIPDAVAIKGTVTGKDGKPIAGIVVQAVDPSTGAVLMTGATARDGTYAIIGLNSQSYAVQFLDPTGTFKTGFYSDHGTVNSLKKATAVKVGSSGRAGIDSQLDKTTTP